LSYDDDKKYKKEPITNINEDKSSNEEDAALDSEQENNDMQQGAYSLLADLS
jgi:hypothetical protein